MDEDAGVKAPVTRLRRRLSVEQSEESKSPAVNTPTKKRTGRRAAKPDLELIDENTPDSTTTKRVTKKAAVKDIIDTEEKPVTPSRRSTRIKSNTSIVSETPLAVDSPRSKRATRRASQVGSDSEAPVTPIRQTRKTRKDSTSNIEKADILSTTKPAINITDVIVEEPESNTTKSTSETNDNTSPSSVRKSPRLLGKTKTTITTPNEKEKSVQASPNKSIDNTKAITTENENEESKEIQISQKNRLSLISSDLINKLNTEAKKDVNIHNKSASALEDQQSIKSKRKRTKSWTTLNVSNEPNFFSDNEELKKKKRDSIKVPILQLNEFNSGDGLNLSLDQSKKDKSILKKKRKSSNSFTVEDIDTSIKSLSNKSLNKASGENVNTSIKMNETSKLFEKEPSADMRTTIYIDNDSDTNSGKGNIIKRFESEDQCVPVVPHTEQIENDIPFLSSNNVSNIGNKSKDEIKRNDSCEPMDVDETIPENLLIAQIKANDTNSSSTYLQANKNESIERVNKSNRKSSITNPNKSGNENKSTLILSQLKDTSTAEINNVTKSPQTKNNNLSKTADDLDTTQENEVNKRNLSLNYVTTSAPLQHKNLQKLGNINTSIITSKIESKVSDNIENETPNNESDLNFSKSAKNKTDKKLKNSINETEKIRNSLSDSTDDSDSDDKSLKIDENIKINKSKSFNKSSNQSISSNENSDVERASDEESQQNNLIDDEAKEADDDYESGDSQDESERKYLKENEIIDKGETLSSENDFSDDSDYEKDSFVVSSDEEDNELLDGTEDDLSMSDNELKMTSKSKKKFNERKAKEQKKASREMFESRHKLNDSNKKQKRQNIISSESEEEEAEIKTKKHNRMRLDSSHEVSLMEDKNVKDVSTNKGKLLSESICDDNIMNEKEITVCNESLKETDPLSTNVKEEPKTPQKSNSTIAFIDAEDEQNVESELTKTQTEFLDPLKDTIAEDDSLSSDNENIMQNYDSMLEGLNKSSKTKSKTCDISLNMDKKQKKKKNTTIVDELNLTQTKSAKKSKNNKQEQKDINSVSENKTKKTDIDDDGSSDSIDLHLLFSEDSNSSDGVQNMQNNVSSNFEQLIPLKRSEGKTNIRENADTSIQNETSFNVSHNKKDKKRKSESTSTSDNTEKNNVSFYIDTEGEFNNSLIKSKKNKKLSLENNDNLDSDRNETTKNKNNTLNESKAVDNGNSDSDAPMDVPFIKEKRKSKEQDNLEEEAIDEIDSAGIVCNKSVTKTPNSEKKKKKKARKSQNSEQTEDEKGTDASINMSQSEKNKKSNHDINEDLNEKDIAEQPNDISLLKTPGSNKKKKLLSQAKSQESDEVEESFHLSILKTPNSQKKKKKSISLQETKEDHISEISLNNSKVKTPGSQKKMPVTDSVEQNQNEALDVTLGSTKKSRKSNTNSFTVESSSATVEPDSIDTSAKKRKRSLPISSPAKETVSEDQGKKELNESLVGNKKKKRKISKTEPETILDAEETTPQDNHLQPVGKENKLKKETKILQNDAEAPKKNKNNKRKRREDDDENRVSKIVKENSFDNVHVPRLPASLLKQLDDKPREISAKKPKLVSTTQFSVVEARKRRNKPSNYLEESIYLNNDESTDKKQKKKLQKPKVLPFVPTALTSASGFTTNFKINIIPSETKFVAQSNTVNNFKDDYILFNKKIKRQGTYELYKRSRNIKISKF